MPTVTRVRAGLATNSSSSHSMVRLPPGASVPDLNIPNGEYLAFENDYRAATEHAKRLFLAATLTYQSPVLWGEDATRDPDIDPGTPEWQARHDAPRTDRWNATPATAPNDYTLCPAADPPAWILSEIRDLCGLDPSQVITRNATTNNSFGDALVIPRNPHGTGPDPVAWTAITAVILDPQVVLYAPEENSWDETVDAHHPQEYDLGTLQPYRSLR